MTSPTSPTRKAILAALLILAILLGVVLLWRYFIVVATSAIAAFTFYPVFRAMKRLVRHDGAAAWLTALATLLSVILPVLLILAVTIREVEGAAHAIADYLAHNDLGTVSQQLISQLNGLLASLTGGGVSVSVDQVRGFITSAAANIGRQTPGVIASSVGGVSGFITSLIIYLYVFVSLTLHYRSLIEILSNLNPLGQKNTNLYLRNAGAMTQAMVRGQFIIAFIQGLLSAVLLYAVGIHYFWIATLVLTFLSIIPLGSGIVVLPIGVALLATGHIWQGLLVLAGHLIIISNVDNILRPALVPKTARLDPALTLLSVFGGISAFGLLGTVIGPVIMILIVTTIRVYLESQSNATKAAA